MTDTDIEINEALMARISRKKKILDKRRPLPKDAVARLREELKLYHTYHSNAIEGNTLSLKETKLIIEEGITLRGKSIKEHLEATGNAEAFELIEALAKKKRPIDHETVQEIHELVTKGQILDTGKYRTANVIITGRKIKPPSFKKIVKLMDEFFKELKGMRKVEPIIVAAYLHYRLVDIHPFIDGNGRVARLVTNLYLMRRGYPAIVLKKDDRYKYYDCLKKADNGDLSDLAELIGRAVDESLTLYISIFGGKDEILPLSALAKGSPYSQEYLSLRARQGILDAVKINNAWHSTRRALEEYIKEYGKSKS